MIYFIFNIIENCAIIVLHRISVYMSKSGIIIMYFIGRKPMENEITAKIMPLRFACQDKEAEKLHKKLSGIKGCDNKLLNLTMDLLIYIDNEEISVSCGKIGLVLVLLSRSMKIPEGQIEVIARFIEEQMLVENLNGRMVLTAYGKLFTISDKISASIDIIKYVFEKLDWKDISGCSEKNRFLEKEGRRYAACLLSQLNNKYMKIEEIRSKYQYIDFIYSSNIYVLQEMLKDKYIKKIIENVFEPLGLLQKEKTIYSLSSSGRKVFEHYSHNMLDEYNGMIDECWESYDRGNFQEAFETAISIISVAGTILEAYNIIGCVYIRRGEYNKAKDVFMYAIELYEERIGDVNGNWSMSLETYISMYYNLGLCDFYIGNFIKALHTFTTIKKTLPYKLESLEMIMSTIKKMIIV